MARIHPAVLNMAFATVEPREAHRRCRCWAVVICAVLIFLTLIGVLAHT
jgi:hypothetical protein